MMSISTEQELIYKNIAVIGAGASGGFASVLLSKNPYNRITIFDERLPFSSLLPTGGGRSNISYSENDVREFVRNYPRGDKFLLSVFSRFGVEKTRKLFLDLGIKTYVQDDRRIFPSSDSSVDVMKKLSKHLDSSNVTIINEKVSAVKKLKNKFQIITEKRSDFFDFVIIATGGASIGFELAHGLGHKIIEPKPSLCALDIEEKLFYSLSGLSFKNVDAKAVFQKNKYLACGDLIFTHKSISGPLVFKLSALSAFDSFSKENPLQITLCISNVTYDYIDDVIKKNQKKSVKNVFSEFAPESFINVLLDKYSIDGNKQVSQIKKSEKEKLINSLFSLKLNAIGRIKNSEIVTAGGVDLNEINPKTMQSKLVDGLFFIGEILNIDGFTGGFNLQNCWSTAYICAVSI